MIHKQGAEYKDDTQIEEAAEETKTRPSWLLPVVFGAIVFGALVFVVMVYPAMKATVVKQEPGQTPGSDVVLGDDSYWNQFDVVDAFTYTDAEILSLRAWGYTGDEIEAYATAETPVAELIQSSMQAQEEARATLSNPESPEYLRLLNTTWLGQPALSLPEYVENLTEGSIYYNEYTYNADYEKIPAHGHSLYLKVYLSDGSFAFMECPLLRYMQLRDSGNIVVSYKTATLQEVTVVYDISEVVVR